MLQKKDKQKIIFFKESIFKVAEQIFSSPNKTFHIRLLEKLTKTSTTAISKAISELKKYGIINLEKTPLTTNIKANQESESYYFYKKIFNLYKLERCGLIWNLKEAYTPEAIVLFGSYAKGEDIENSDIDILIISTKKTYDPGKFLQEMEKELARKINLHILESIQKSPAEFKNTIANGVVLYGYLKLI